MTDVWPPGSVIDRHLARELILTLVRAPAAVTNTFWCVVVDRDVHSVAITRWNAERASSERIVA